MTTLAVSMYSAEAEASDLDSGTVERKNLVARKVADCLPVKISFVKSLN